MRGLPANIPLGELQKQRMEAIGPTHDTGNPTTASEFFDTRQVTPLCSCLRILHPRPMQAFTEGSAGSILLCGASRGRLTFG